MLRDTAPTTSIGVTPAATTRCGSTVTVTCRRAPPVANASLTPGTEAKRGTNSWSVRSYSASKSTCAAPSTPPSTCTRITKLPIAEVRSSVEVTFKPAWPRGCSRSMAAAMRRSSASRTLMSVPASKRTVKLPLVPLTRPQVSATCGIADTRACSGSSSSRSTISGSAPARQKYTYRESP